MAGPALDGLGPGEQRAACRAGRPAPRVRAASTALAPAAAWWRGLAVRERTGLGIAGAVLAGYIVWAVAVGPALQTLQRAPLEHDLLEAQFQTMQRLATESQQLRATPPLPHRRRGPP